MPEFGMPLKKIEPQLEKITLYMSLTDIYLFDGEKYLLIPFSSIKNVNILSYSPIKIELEIHNMKFLLEDKEAVEILALAHLLSVFTHKKKLDTMKLIVLFHIFGMKSVPLLSRTLGVPINEVEATLKKLVRDGYISNDGNVTLNGILLLDKKGQDIALKMKSVEHATQVKP